MKIYLVILGGYLCTDVEIRAYTDKKEAIEDAEGQAYEYAQEGIDQDKNEMPSGWVYRRRLNNKGSYIWIEEIKLHGKLS